ncbi:hypothetical protein GQ457_07G034090 [Hibiscus cannabinus]
MLILLELPPFILANVADAVDHVFDLRLSIEAWFGAEDFHPGGRDNRAITWVRYYSGVEQHASPTASLRNVPCLWKRPESGCICLNVDGAVSSLTNMGSIGGLLWDHNGWWISDFQKGIGNCMPLQAELWAIFIGLQHAWDRGIKILQVQSDCKDAIQMLTSSLANVNSSSLVRAIVKLCKRGWSVDLIWIARSSNQAADALAKRADVSAFETTDLHSPLEFLRPLLSHDISSFTFDLA